MNETHKWPLFVGVIIIAAILGYNMITLQDYQSMMETGQAPHPLLRNADATNFIWGDPTPNADK